MQLTHVQFEKQVSTQIFFDYGQHEFINYLAQLKPVGKVLIVTDDIVDNLYAQGMHSLLCSNGYFASKFHL